MLNEFHSAIQRRTPGRLSDLSIDVIGGAIVVEGRTETYYAVQLALAAIQAFTADFPKLTPARMSFRVNGHPLVLSNPLAGGNGQTADNADPVESNDSIFHDPHGRRSPSSLMSSDVATAAT